LWISYYSWWRVGHNYIEVIHGRVPVCSGGALIVFSSRYKSTGSRMIPLLAGFGFSNSQPAFFYPYVKYLHIIDRKLPNNLILSYKIRCVKGLTIRNSNVVIADMGVIGETIIRDMMEGILTTYIK
jgi:hypothetical protein